MNRVIKFRVWDALNKRMIHMEDGDELIFFGGGGWMLGLDNGEDNHGEEIRDGNLMQFTGLHDKNGAEIYEGDIVKMSLGDDVRIGPVVYEAPEFLLEMQGYYADIQTLYGLEVIGNIYQHKHLLE